MRSVKALVLLSVLAVGVAAWAWTNREAPKSRDVAAATAKPRTFQPAHRVILPNA